MKVIFVGTFPPTIGISPYCLHLANSLNKKIDLEVIDFKIFPKKSETFIGENKIDDKFYSDILKKIKCKKILSWYNPFSALMIGTRLKGDILHIQWWIPTLFIIYFPLIIMAKIRKLKIIITMHNILPHEHLKSRLIIDRICNKLLLPFGDYIIVHNTRNKNKLIKLFNINNKKIKIIAHGTLNLIHDQKILKNQAKKYLKLPSDKKIILFFGYIRPYKGIDNLLESFSLLRKEINNILLLIVGQPIYDEWKKYNNIIDKLNLHNDTRIDLGFVPESLIQYYFNASDIVVLPYKHLDTHGGVGALALAFNKPLVVTNVGGSPDFVKDKRVISEPNDKKGFARCLKLVLTDDYLYEKLVNDSKDLAEKFCWDTIADQTIDIYNKKISILD